MTICFSLVCLSIAISSADLQRLDPTEIPNVFEFQFLDVEDPPYVILDGGFYDGPGPGLVCIDYTILVNRPLVNGQPGINVNIDSDGGDDFEGNIETGDIIIVTICFQNVGPDDPFDPAILILVNPWISYPNPDIIELPDV